jgi:hypothetical protein
MAAMPPRIAAPAAVVIGAGRYHNPPPALPRNTLLAGILSYAN